jgi:nucleoside-diphosphate-sugar epimerase
MTTFRNNLVSTVNLLLVVNEIGCKRIILAGSLEEPEQGDLSAVPCSPYAVAKWAGSAYARMFHALYQLPVVILRIFMVYGPAQQDLQKLIPYTILSLLRGEAPKLTSGRRPVDWIYVEDVVEGFLAAAQAAHIEGNTIDIGSGKLISIRAIVEHLVRLINPQIQPLFGALSERSFEQIRVADPARSYALIGWKATTSLEEGLKRTVDWYRKQLKRGSP